MTRWLRLYDEILDDPKVQHLEADQFRAWINLLCLTARHEGVLPAIGDIAFALRRPLAEAQALLEGLVAAGLIDRRKGGPSGRHFVPHGWERRQFRSDSSTTRVQRFRARSRAAAATAPESDSDSESDSPKAPVQGAGAANDLAKELCRRASIACCGPAAVRQASQWLADGISCATIREIVTEMAAGVEGTTRSLKRFDAPVRRAHAERAPAVRKGRSYEPKTEAELRRAIAAGEAYGFDVERHRVTLEELLGNKR